MERSLIPMHALPDAPPVDGGEKARQRRLGERPVALVGRKHPALNTRCTPFYPDSVAHWTIARRLAATAEKIGARRAVALAAPQIGQPFQIVCFLGDTGLGPFRLFANPTVEAIPETCDGLEVWDETTDVEGCLSLPGRWFWVPAAYRVRVTALALDDDEPTVYEWECSALAARAWQHEAAHLEGRLVSTRGTPTILPRDGTRPPRQAY